MLKLMFRCPYTNKTIASGIELEAESLKDVSDYPISLQCPHCGRQHHGTIADGCLSDERGTPAVPRDA